MTIVIDASVAVKWLTPEQDSDKAKAILQGAREGRLSMLAPEILPAEVANYLWKAVIRSGLDPMAAFAQYERFRRACPELVRISVLAQTALRFAVRFRRSVYDCLYVALASETPCELVTADEKLCNSLRGQIAQIRLLRDWA